MKNDDVRLKFYTAQLEPIEVPYFNSGVPAGFPSPAADFEEDRISFDKIVFGNKISTKFVVKVEVGVGVGSEAASSDEHETRFKAIKEIRAKERILVFFIFIFN